MQLYKKQTLS